MATREPVRILDPYRIMQQLAAEATVKARTGEEFTRAFSIVRRMAEGRLVPLPHVSSTLVGLMDMINTLDPERFGGENGNPLEEPKADDRRGPR